MEEAEVVLDLSGRKLKRLDKAPVNQTFATALVLDNNLLQNLNNLDSYGELERVCIYILLRRELCISPNINILFIYIFTSILNIHVF